jgi:WD40 repeat protein
MSPTEPKSDVPAIPDHVLVRVIGSGAYGDVWLGRTILGTARAIKVIQRSSFERDQPFLREFEGVRRYEPVSRSSPSLVPILQVGRDEAAGFFYSVMELADAAAPGQPATPDGVDPGPASEARYEARTLRTDLVRQGRLSIADCVEVGLAMAEALQALHGAGLVHRDIKPSNIIYLRGRACLADVGLVSEARESSSCVGTAGYMAPEGPGLPPSDLYSLGMVLYEISTGLRLADYPSTPPHWADPGHGVEWEFHEIVLRLGARNPARRHRDATELRDELLLLRGGRSVRRLRVRERRKRILLQAAIAAAALGLLGWGMAVAQQGRRREAEARRRDSESQQVALGASRARDILNDDAPGKRSRALAILRQALALRPGHPELRDLAAGALMVPELVPENSPWHAPVRLDPAPPRRWPVGPVSHAVGLFDPGLRTLFRWQPQGWIEGVPVRGGGSPEFLPPPVPGLNLEFISSVSLDGRWLLVRDSTERIHVVSRADGRSVLQVRIDPKYLGREFTPDGRWLLAGRADGAFDLLPIGHPGPARRVPVGVPPHDLVVRADGRWVAAINSTNSIVRFAHLDSARVERRWELPPGETVQMLGWNSEGDLVHAASEMQIFIGGFDRHPIQAKRLVKEDHGIFGVAFSPDSAWVLSTGYNGRSRIWDWSSETALSEYAGAGTAIQWSPDGRWIAWKDEFQWELIRFEPPTGWSVIPEVPPEIASEATAGPSVVRFHPAGDRWASGSYDGIRLYPRSGRNNAAHWPCDDGPVRHLTFSDDGTRLRAMSLGHRVTLAVEGDATSPRLRLIDRQRLPGSGRGDITPAGEAWLVSTNGSFWSDAQGRWRSVDVPPRSVIGSVHPDGRWLGSWGIDAVPAVLVRDEGFRPRLLEYPPELTALGEAGELVFCPVSRRVFGAMTHGLVAWDVDSGKILWRRLLDPVGVYGRVAVTPDGRRLAVALGTRSLHLLQATDGAPISQLRMPEKLRITSLTWDARGRRLLAGSVVHASYLWDLDALQSGLAEAGVAVPDLALPVAPAVDR